MTDRARIADRAAAASLLVAFLVFAAKAGAAWLTGSMALLADAADSAVNPVASGLVWIAVRWSRRPPDAGHPFGHGKAEYLSAGAVAAIILTASGAIGWEALRRLGHPGAVSLEPIGIGLSLLAAAANLTLGFALLRAGRRARSPALQADGRHVLSDVSTTVGSLVGVGAAGATGLLWLDPAAALLVALHIGRQGAHVGRDALAGLLDEALPEAELQRVTAAIEGQLSPGQQAHDVRTRRAAAQAFVEFDLVVPAATTVAESHALCDRLEAAIVATLPGARVSIHVEPGPAREHDTNPALPSVAG